jgi:hypothetical protein
VSAFLGSDPFGSGLVGVGFAAAGIRTTPQPIIVLMLAGFAIGVFGYLSGSRWLVGLGVALVFIAGLLAPQY